MKDEVFRPNIFLESPVAGKDVRSLLRQIVQTADIKPVPEIFPKQDQLTEDTQLGSLIKLTTITTSGR